MLYIYTVYKGMQIINLIVDSLGGLKNLACFRPEMFSGQVPLNKIPR